MYYDLTELRIYSEVSYCKELCVFHVMHALQIFNRMGMSLRGLPGSVIKSQSLSRYTFIVQFMRAVPTIFLLLSLLHPLQLNPCLSFHCNGIGSMVLRFSCRGQAHKFDVSPSAPLVSHQSPGLKVL